MAGRLTVPYLIQITIDLWNSIFLFVMAFLVYFIYSKSVKLRSMMEPIPLTIELLLLCVGVFFYNLFDAASLFFNGASGTAAAVGKRIGEYGYFTTGLLLMLLLLITARKFCFPAQAKPVYTGCGKVLMLMQCVNAVLLLTNPFLHGLFTVDSSNLYARVLPGYYIWCTINIVTLAVSGVICVLNYKQYPRFQKKVIRVIVSIAMAAFIGNLFITQISLHCIGASLITMLLFFLYSQNRTEIMVKNYQDIEKLRTDLLLSQISPHFIHNAITAIVYYVDKDTEKTRSALINFSKYLRRNIDSLNMNELRTIEDEIEHVKIYLSLAELRFGDDLKVEYDLGADSFMLPVLTVQPLVENAVKYGIQAAETGSGTVKIQTTEDNANYIIRVSDDGAGFDTETLKNICQTHTGLRSVKNRLALFCNGQLSIESKPGAGTICTVTIPKMEGPDENTDN